MKLTKKELYDAAKKLRKVRLINGEVEMELNKRIHNPDGKLLTLAEESASPKNEE